MVSLKKARGTLTKRESKFISALDKELKNSLPSTFFPLYRMATKLTHMFVTVSFEAFQRK